VSELVPSIPNNMLTGSRHNFDPSRTIIIGDRLDTDIAFGKSGGLATLLVMTGA
jgi:ribonucleotide monophosphatase NagD (HAD superfamily)